MGLLWDIFCRVIDNFGDVGVSWRLARDLAARGESVRLWLDDASALQWMAATGTPTGISVHQWDESFDAAEAGDVVIETFGCELPQAFLARMAQRAEAPLWINLEYLSAESYVERSHLLKSPQFSGAGRGLNKLFFYPGFTARTGGLLRERELLTEQASFDASAWLAARQIMRRPGERIVSLFAYANSALPEMLRALATEPTLLLACPGAAQQQMLQLQATSQLQQLQQQGLRWQALPFLSQADYDRLLWACDLNYVRGEDSFVRAQWAGRPFVWQIYPQHDGAHGAKLDAFLDLFLANCDDAQLAQQTRSLWHRWNGLTDAQMPMPDANASQTQALKWREQLTQQSDLVSQLLSLASNSS